MCIPSIFYYEMCVCVCDSELYYYYHCVCVLLQLVRRYFLMMLLEQVFQESLRDKRLSHNQTTKQSNTMCDTQLHTRRVCYSDHPTDFNSFMSTSLKNQPRICILKKNMLKRSWKRTNISVYGRTGNSGWGLQSFSASATTEGCSLSRNCVIGSAVWRGVHFACVDKLTLSSWAEM